MVGEGRFTLVHVIPGEQPGTETHIQPLKGHTLEKVLIYVLCSRTDPGESWEIIREGEEDGRETD